MSELSEHNKKKQSKNWSCMRTSATYTIRLLKDCLLKQQLRMR